jgi:hypothetical protein
MSPGSPDASDELQVIPRRESGGAPAPSPGPSTPPPSGSGVRGPVDPLRRKRLTGVVGGALGLCAFILVAAGVARVLRPRDSSASPAQPSASGSAAATPAASTPPPPAPTPSAAPPPAAPTSGTLLFDPPAKPGKIWIDGKKITVRSVDLPCGTHKIKIGRGRTKPVTLTCGAQVHLSR